MRLRSFRQSPEPRFYLVLAFLLWSLIPHYQIIFHAHDGEPGGHAHATLTAGEIEFADQALQALPSASPGEFGGQPSTSAAPPVDGAAWSEGPGLLAHAHLLQDLNSVPVLLPVQASSVEPAAGASRILPYHAPAPAAPAHRPARGPPAPFLA